MCPGIAICNIHIFIHIALTPLSAKNCVFDFAALCWKLQTNTVVSIIYLCCSLEVKEVARLPLWHNIYSIYKLSDLTSQWIMHSRCVFTVVAQVLSHTPMSQLLTDAQWLMQEVVNRGPLCPFLPWCIQYGCVLPDDFIWEIVQESHTPETCKIFKGSLTRNINWTRVKLGEQCMVHCG